MRKEIENLLKYLNAEYLKLHQNYEENFWVSHMGDHSVDKKKDEALQKLDAFRSNPELRQKVADLLERSKNRKLEYWLKFFDCYQAPEKLRKLKDKISALETQINKKQTTRK